MRTAKQVRASVVLAAVISSAGVAGPAVVGCRASPASTTLIGGIREGLIAADDIQRVHIVKERKGRGMFSKEQYDAQPRTRLPSELLAQVVQSFGSTEVLARDVRLDNHPRRKHRGYVEVTLKSGAYYYVEYYVLVAGDGTTFAILHSFQENSCNPNVRREYRSMDFWRFLEEHDPWYGTAR